MFEYFTTPCILACTLTGPLQWYQDLLVSQQTRTHTRWFRLAAPSLNMLAGNEAWS